MDSRILVLIVACISLSTTILFLANRSNPSLQINPSALIIDSISSVFRMFAALAISFLMALMAYTRRPRADDTVPSIFVCPYEWLDGMSSKYGSYRTVWGTT